MKADDGELKYPNVGRVVKAALSISHGQGDVERGFSKSGRFLTEDRSFTSETTLNAAMCVRSALQTYYDSKPNRVPMSKSLLTLGRSAYSRYKAHVEEEKARKEIEQKEKEEEKRLKVLAEEREKEIKEQKKITEEEDKPSCLKQKEKEKTRTADKLLYDAEERLKVAMDTNDMDGVRLAHAMLYGVKKAREVAEEEKKTVESLEKQVEKRKNSIITAVSKKTKT